MNAPKPAAAKGFRPFFRLLALCAPLAMTPFASASPIAWTAQAVSHTDLSQPADVTPVSTAGTLVAAVNVGGAAATVNGVPFAAGTGNINFTTCNWSVPSITWGNNYSGYYGTGGGDPLNSANTWLATGKYGNNTNNVGTLNLLNLTVGHQYSVQLFFADIRPGSDGYKVIVDGGSPNQFAFGPTGGPYGYLVMNGTFIADATSQAITMRDTQPDGTAFNTHINAFQFRDQGLPAITQAPTFSPVAGTHIGAQTVTISCTTEGATIYYTTDGNPPTTSSTSGTSGLTVNVPSATTMTIQAFAVSAGNADSTVSSATYTTLTTSSGVWTNPAGGTWGETTNWQGNAIPFAGTADFSTLDLTANADVTLDGARTIGHLVFGDTAASHDWQLNTGTGGPLTLDTGGATPTITVNNRTATLGAVVAGTRGLTKSGSGTLALTGANTYTGATALDGGTLQVTDLASHRSSIVTATGTTFTADVPTNVSAPYSFNITGTGTATKTGAGDWLIGSAGRVGIAMSPGGLFDIQEGTIRTGSHMQSFTGNQGSINISTGATLDISAENIWADALTGGGSIIMSYGASGARTVTVGVATGSGTFSGIIGSPGLIALAKTGTGTQILTGNNTYTLATTISGGTLQLGNGGSSGSLATASSITNNGTLAFNRSDSISQGVHFTGNAIGGTGGLTQMGPGTLTLTTHNPYTGTTSVTGGELSIGLAPGTTWTVPTLDLANGTTLTLRNFDSNSGNPAASATVGLTTAGTVTIKVEGSFTVGTFPLIYYPVDGEIGGAGYSAFVLAPLPDGVEAHLAHDPDLDSINLVVEAAGTPFSNWISTNYPSLTGDDALPGADPDGDGLNNLGEFAFKGDPTSGSDNGLLAVLPTDTNANGSKELTFTVAVRTGATFAGSPSPAATVDGVTYTIQGSLDLNAFTTGVTELTPALTPAQTGLPDITGSGWEYHSFSLAGSEGLPNKGFLRAKAEHL